MEHTIKFRGKEIDSNKWLYGDLFQRSGCYPEILFPYFDKKGKTQYAEIAVKEKTVGQFIGRKDKDKTEVYDGDIITVNGDFPKLVKFIPERAAFCIANICDLNNQDQLDIWMQPPISWWEKMDIDVIGNIHDNPELLNINLL